MIKNLGGMTYYIETYGCEMNKAESNALRLELSKLGYNETQEAKKANWLIVNSCSVRNGAEERVIGRLGELKTLKNKNGNQQKIVLMGCMAERLKEDKDFASRYQLDGLIGSFDKKVFVEKLSPTKETENLKNTQLEGTSPFFGNYGRTGHRSYVPIMHGCNAYCSYCIVPTVRGREVSRPVEEILQEIREQIASGIKEIVLLGQIVNNYKEGSDNFASVVKKIGQIDGDVWFRFTSSHPRYMNEEIMQALQADGRFVPHLHLAAQHGSNKVLKEMNRHYTAQQFLDILEMVKQYWPNVAVTTDLMVGFPGESKEDFEELLSFVQKAQFSDAFTYAYSDRSGTVADLRTDKVGEEVKIARLTRLITLQRTLSSERLKENKGKTYRALVLHPAKEEGYLYALTNTSQNVVFKGNEDVMGQFVSVKIEESSGQTMKGILV